MSSALEEKLKEVEGHIEWTNRVCPGCHSAYCKEKMPDAIDFYTSDGPRLISALRLAIEQRNGWIGESEDGMHWYYRKKENAAILAKLNGEEK